MSRSVKGRLGSNFNMLQVSSLGLLIVYTVALIPTLFGFDPLSHQVFTQSSLIFDIGVFLAVVGVSVRIVRRLREEVYG
jgi:hypothetical protein